MWKGNLEVDYLVCQDCELKVPSDAFSYPNGYPECDRCGGPLVIPHQENDQD